MKISKLIRVGCTVTAMSTIAIGIAPIAMAQTVTTPQLSFPQENSSWGCYFFASCERTEGASVDR
ncbi:hypothetical protein [Yoonia algicola]|uniref:Uncharacterized protein n=1 Tax=Yoonia algicola TaxID=3137368 RepID=A0AAN0M2U6_9RHOB